MIAKAKRKGGGGKKKAGTPAREPSRRPPFALHRGPLPGAGGADAPLRGPPAAPPQLL
jgi:hypothetical protein